MNYPKGQKTYVDPKNQWRYTQPVGGDDGDDVIPPGSTIYGFYFYPCPLTHSEHCYTPGYGHGGWIGCPPVKQDEDQRWIIYSNLVANGSVPTGRVTDCRFFEAISSNIEEEAEVYLYA